MSSLRLENLLICRERFPSDAAFADAAGIAASFFGQIKREERNVGEKLARKIEKNLNLENLWLDHKHTKAEKILMEPAVEYTLNNIPLSERELDLVEEYRQLSDHNKAIISLVTRSLLTDAEIDMSKVISRKTK